MKYNTLGKTGLRVPALSFGASSLGGAFHDVAVFDAIETVHAAIDLGLNFIDVSPYYSGTVAELILGRALRGIRRDRYSLATKVGRYSLDYFDFSAERVTRSVDESLSRLGLDYIDLIQCHDIEFGSIDQVVEETIPALEKLRDQGKVRYIGITGLPLKVFEEVVRRSCVDTILSYCHYALNDSALAGLLPLLQERQVGIINASPFSMGLLTNRGAPTWHPAPLQVKEVCSQAARYCREQGEDLAKLALQFCLQNPEIHTTLVGTASPGNLRKNAAWAEAPINEDLMREVRAILAPIHNVTWLQGRPENNAPELTLPS
ncbi:MAG: aldo/keto reductase [Acidobacteriota bacterium]